MRMGNRGSELVGVHYRSWPSVRTLNQNIALNLGE